MTENNIGPYAAVNINDTTRSDPDFADLPTEKVSKFQVCSSGKMGSRVCEKSEINPAQARFPFCIVWTPLPLITWLLPFIGHTGIAMSDGIIHDFAGPYTIGIDDLAFGETHKYVRLDIEDTNKYDRAVEKADQIYEQMMHNLFCNNCHSHVARVLNKYNYQGRSNHTMIGVWWLTITRSKYVSWGHLIMTYIGIIVILSVFLLIKYL
eukprot:403331607